MTPDIFREYDIRGIAGKQITEDDVILIGKGIGTFLAQQNCFRLTVGRDCRLTSDHFSEKLIEGLMSTGCHVTDIGVCPTPVLYFSIPHLAQEGGVMLTASHNPPEYNGFKVCKFTDSVHGEQIQQIRHIIEKKKFASGTGSRAKADVVTPYTRFLMDNIHINKPLNVGIDAGNGTAGVIAVPVLKALGCNIMDIYCDMDGRFPNHEADPTVAKNMADLIRMVREKNLDLGIGY
ncbi:MAG: phosphomannomutase, partial [Desulfobacteraceae bacterium]|nr:phosphomannomutase [Desulfobacteraceae bacterium]